MSKFAYFFNQSSTTSADRAGVAAPELRGSFAESFGLPLLLATFVLTWLAGLATSV